LFEGQTLQHTKRREVDLTASSQVTEAKLPKKAAIEKELQSAIAALKRPNPRMAVKELIEASDKRGNLRV
jgi:DNA replication regulator SLD3